MTSQHFDAVVIGAGQGGDPLARSWATAGRKTVLIERAEVGGTCINTGCTPTKTMIASARIAYLAGRMADYGVAGTITGMDIAKVRDRKREIVTDFRGGDEQKIDKTENLTLMRGDAAFTAPCTISVKLRNGETTQITGDQIFINTGASPSVPSLDGLDQVPYFTNATLEEIETVPEHLIVLGGNYIGLEFGQMFRRFGSNVTVIERSATILSHEDDDVAEEMTKILTGDGLQIIAGAAAKSVSKSGDIIEIVLETPSGMHTVQGSHLLIATGRTPNTSGLGLEAAEVALDETGHIKVNEKLETTAAGVWAIGDVKGGPQFTHISYDDYRILEANLLKDGQRTTTDRPVPYTMFTDPQLGRVGLSEKEARKQNLDIKVAKLPMTSVARALETDETRGFMKAIIDAKSNQILGCTIIGVDGGETMAIIEVAMMGNLSCTALRNGVFAHPTWAESLNNLFMTID